MDIVKAAVENADYVIAEVNPNMPRTLGDSSSTGHGYSLWWQMFAEAIIPLIEKGILNGSRKTFLWWG